MYSEQGRRRENRLNRYDFLIVSRKKYDESSADLAADILESAQQLVHLEVALAKTELKEMAIRNGIAAGMMAGAALLLVTAVITAVPVLLVMLFEPHWLVALIWIIVYLIAAGSLGFVGFKRLQLKAPPKTLGTLKETKAWVLHQISSSSR